MPDDPGLPGPPLTVTDVVQRMEATKANPCGTWPNEDPKANCLLLLNLAWPGVDGTGRGG